MSPRFLMRFRILPLKISSKGTRRVLRPLRLRHLLPLMWNLANNSNMDHMANMDSPDLQNTVHMDMTLVSVSHDDESKFTPEEWAEILKQIELGNISWED